ncbi:hypothetical protein M407DRAFT_21806 [Tulasnella calospora MUT 4182]|uniref:F-box domain-containing protein n=1 Tax=Tulasnella calospora MUT 4182 TaxID=1051891 RepID=A0A0C3L5H9_9AGAM|nr:hypothetical protein M407DRAFT_21806 [Tulasnella calospora MUT 4182]
MHLLSDHKKSSKTTRIASIVQEHIDAFIHNIFDIYRSSEDTPEIKTSSEAPLTEIAIWDAVEVAIRRKKNRRTLFSRLDTDVVHSIFGTALDMDQIHDPNFPLPDLDVHRRQINRMRQVSTMWNDFLLSSPRYWQVLSIKSPPPTIAAGIKRSGSAPLGVYCIGNFPQPAPDQLTLELVWCAARVQTLRSDDLGAYQFCRVLLRTRTSALQTLQLRGPGYPKRPIDPLRYLSIPPRIRHLTADGWRPSSGAVWLMGLRELVLHGLSQVDAEILLVLSACVNLERLVIQCLSRSHVMDLSGAPSTITLACLQVMDLTFGSEESAGNLIRRLVTPRLLWGSLDVGVWALETHRTDYCRFMSQTEGRTLYPKSASIRIETVRSTSTRVVYGTESRRFAFESYDWVQAQVQLFHDLVQESQGMLREPALTVTVISSFDYVWPFLKSLDDQNVRTIKARLHEGEADGLLAAIAAPSDLADVLVTNTTTDLPFESLKSIAIHDAKLDLARLTVIAEAWQGHLQRESKQWLEEVDLVGCSVTEMGLDEASSSLEAIGVTFRPVRCLDFEEPWF